MITQFISGLLAAWVVAQLALGVFFALAYVFGRRETEYLLFGLTMLPLAVATAGMGQEYAAADFVAWRVGAQISALGLIVAVAVHLHFLLQYARVRPKRPIAVAAYALAAGFAVLRLGPWWLVPGSERVDATSIFGHELLTRSMELRAPATVFFALAGLTVAAGPWLLLRAYHSGRRDALPALLGSLVVVVAAGHDLLLVTRVSSGETYASPHAFLLYALAVASTLLLRYRGATGELEQTALSLEARTAELQHSYRELDAMENELLRQTQLAAVGRLAAAIAHEVRNPLAVIVNATAQLRRGDLPSLEQEGLLGMIDQEVSRLNALVGALVRFARPISVTWSVVELRELAEGTGHGLPDEYRVEADIPRDPALATMSCDLSLLRLALDNLIENARHAMPQGGVIRISAARDRLEGADCIRLDLQDTGEGMTPEVKARAMDPFFSTRSGSYGLGLPIVKRIMEAHGGDVTLDTAPRAGTTVHLFIPDHGAEVGLDRPSRRLRLRRPTSE